MIPSSTVTVEHLVDPLDRVDDARAFDREVVFAALAAEELLPHRGRHHATSSIWATLTSTGPCVRRS